MHFLTALLPLLALPSFGITAAIAPRATRKPCGGTAEVSNVDPNASFYRVYCNYDEDMNQMVFDSGKIMLPSPGYHEQLSFYHAVTDASKFEYIFEITFYPSPDHTQAGSFSLQYADWSSNVALYSAQAAGQAVPNDFAGGFTAPMWMV